MTKKVEETNLDKIKESVKSVNEEVSKTTSEIFEDVKGKMKTTMNFDLKKTVKEVNDFTLETAETIVEGAIVNGEKWQDLTHKAIKGSLKIAENQQNMVFDALEEVKNQMNKSKSRIKKLVNTKK